MSSQGLGDNPDSAAKILEALTKASSELEKSVDILTGQLVNFNQSLEKSFNDDLAAAKERMEAAMRLNLDGLMRDKEAVMKALAEYKQAEIEKVILSGKTVRSGLAAQVEDATRALSATVTGKIGGIREHLAQPELEMRTKYEELQNSLQTAVIGAHEQLIKAKVAEEELLAITARDFDGKVKQEIAQGQEEFSARFSERKAQLENHGEQVVNELAQKYDEVIRTLDASFQEGVAAVEQNSQQAADKLKQLSASGAGFMVEQDQAFASTLNDLSGLLNGLYETRLNNLAAQSRTEIVSAAEHAEECLSTTKAELQVCLKEFQRDYVNQFEALQSKFEKLLEEYSRKKDSSAMRGLKEDRVREQLHSLFRRLGQEMIDSASSAAARIEAEFQKSMDAFALRIETAKTQACESLERESKLMQKELTKSFQEFEKQMDELKAQASGIDKQGRDVANIVMTVRQANLEL